MHCAFRLMVRLSLFLGEQALHEVEDGWVTVMTLFGEKSREPTVRLRHQSVYDDNVFMDLSAMMNAKGCFLRVSIATIEHIH